MIATFNTPATEIPISGSLDAVRSSQIDWRDARSEYDHSVEYLLAAIRHCSEPELSDEETQRSGQARDSNPLIRSFCDQQALRGPAPR
jgi:hypothetical protein